VTAVKLPVSVLLWAGVLGGVGLTVWNLAGPGGEAAPPKPGGKVVAMVDGAEVTGQAYFTRLAALSAERRSGPLTRAQRKHVLDQLVAEELLLARALELGLPRRDLVTRRRLVAAMVEHLTADADARGAVSEAEARRYHAAHPAQFRGASRHLVRRVFFRGADAGARARTAHAELKAGASFAELSARSGDTPILPLPDGPLLDRGLRRYLGPTAARAARELSPGQFSDPIKGADGHVILLLERREAGKVLPFEQVKAAAEALVRRQRRARLMDEGIGRLRRAAQVTLDDAVLDPERTPIPARYLRAARAPGLETDGR